MGRRQWGGAATAGRLCSRRCGARRTAPRPIGPAGSGVGAGVAVAVGEQVGGVVEEFFRHVELHGLDVVGDAGDGYAAAVADEVAGLAVQVRTRGAGGAVVRRGSSITRPPPRRGSRRGPMSTPCTASHRARRRARCRCACSRLLVGDEVGADESGVLTAEGGRVRGGAAGAVGCAVRGLVGRLARAAGRRPEAGHASRSSGSMRRATGFNTSSTPLRLVAMPRPFRGGRGGLPFLRAGRPAWTSLCSDPLTE